MPMKRNVRETKEFFTRDPARCELPICADERLSEAECGEGAERRRAARANALQRSSAPQFEDEGEIFHAQCTLSTANARFTLHMRRTGEKVIVIALCSLRHVEMVRRVLAEAALAMRSRGEQVDASVHAFAAQVCA